jgi:hypothetical protein
MGPQYKLRSSCTPAASFLLLACLLAAAQRAAAFTYANQTEQLLAFKKEMLTRGPNWAVALAVRPSTPSTSFSGSIWPGPGWASERLCLLPGACRGRRWQSVLPSNCCPSSKCDHTLPKRLTPLLGLHKSQGDRALDLAHADLELPYEQQQSRWQLQPLR